MLTWISLLLNVGLLAGALLPAIVVWRLNKRRLRGRRVRVYVCVCGAAVAGLLTVLNLDYHGAAVVRPGYNALKMSGKIALRASVLATARSMLGDPMLAAEHPDGVLCCELAFRPLTEVCGIDERIRNDYAASGRCSHAFMYGAITVILATRGVRFWTMACSPRDNGNVTPVRVIGLMRTCW